MKAIHTCNVHMHVQGCTRVIHVNGRTNLLGFLHSCMSVPFLYVSNSIVQYSIVYTCLYMYLISVYYLYCIYRQTYMHIMSIVQMHICNYMNICIVYVLMHMPTIRSLD